MSRKMKNSGIDWLGEIPEEWKKGKVKNFYNFFTGFTPDTKNYAYYDSEDGYEWATIGDLNMSIVNETKSKISKMYIDDYKPLVTKSGSLLYSFKLSVGQVAFTDRNIYTNEAIASFSSDNNPLLNFLFYSSSFIVENANENIYGAKLLNQDLINNAAIIFPPLNEQKSIANFLDNKCKKIDTLISLEETAITELIEYKKSIIQKAVTKGIIKGRKLKNSYIDWIGEIPDDWEISKLKSCCFMKSGDNLTSNEICENNVYPVYGGNGLRGYYNNYNRNGNYLLIGRQGALCGNIHKINSKFWATDHAVVVEINESTNINWYYYMLIYMNLNQYSESAAQPGLSVQKIQDLSTCFPPINEQKTIAEYLDKKINSVDNLISLKQQKIIELKEYKKSLIYEYVTGKKQPPKKDTK